MPYLAPHFDPDVFVSYSHGDPRGAGDSPLKAWTQALIRRLERHILSLDTEFDDLRIWMDLQIDPTTRLTEDLKEKVGRSCVLIVVMSRRYLASSWCRDELEWFRNQIQWRSGDLGRVFVIRAQDTDMKAWPEFLCDERGHEMPGFWFHDRETGFPWGWPDLQDTNAEFSRELSRLQLVLTRRLRELRERAEKCALEAQVATIRRKPAIGPRRVYLHAGLDAEAARAEIDRVLIQEGIVPQTAQTSGRDLAGWQRDSAERIRVAQRCEALVLLRTDKADRFFSDLADIGIDERERIVEARGGAPLPCAVLDRTGPPLALDPSMDIATFDITQDGWQGAFRRWLDNARTDATGAP